MASGEPQHAGSGCVSATVSVNSAMGRRPRWRNAVMAAFVAMRATQGPNISGWRSVDRARNACKKVSWVMSSASAWFPTRWKATAWTRGACRSKSMAKAASSPHSEHATRSASADPGCAACASSLVEAGTRYVMSVRLGKRYSRAVDRLARGLPLCMDRPRHGVNHIFQQPYRQDKERPLPRSPRQQGPLYLAGANGGVQPNTPSPSPTLYRRRAPLHSYRANSS